MTPKEDLLYCLQCLRMDTSDIMASTLDREFCNEPMLENIEDAVSSYRVENYALKLKHTKEELEQWLSSLDFETDGSLLYGIVWLKRDQWLVAEAKLTFRMYCKPEYTDNVL